MRILISGGAGFIGSHLCDYFINHNCSIICLDNLITGQKENIRHLLKNKKFKFIQADISESIKIKEKIDRILHFASPASPKDYLKYPIETLKTNSFGTYNLLELALKNKAVFLLASSSEVYGDPQEHPQTEKYFGNINTTSPRAVYDESKRFAETLTYSYHTKYKVSVRIARIFNTYGPRMRIDDGRIIPNLINQALTNQPFTIYGKGNQTRSFCYISDMVQAITKLLKTDYPKPINLGNPTEITILQLIKIISKMTGTKYKIKYSPLPEDDPKRRKPDTTLAKKYLRWSPKINLEKGLQQTIEWVKQL